MTHPRAVALVIAAIVAVPACRDFPSDPTLLQRSWKGYVARFVTADGRVFRPEEDNDTVSEGQAYTMLRAAWMDDQATFDRVWNWTRLHLMRTGRPAPALMAWRWTPASGGVTDWNVATDADTDLALALVIAGDRWHAPTVPGIEAYHASARAVLTDLVDHAVVVDAEGARLMLPGTWADERAEGRGVILNPSYFAPAAYRVFSRLSGDVRWNHMAAGAYQVMDAVCSRASSPQPIPDWVRWTSSREWWPDGRTTEARSGWDAIRVPWRIATDFLWFKTPEAEHVLSACLAPFVRAQRDRHAGMAAEYSLGGDVVSGDDHPLANAMYAFALSSDRDRDRLLARVRGSLIEAPGGLFFGEADRYYVNSLAYLPFLARAGRYPPPSTDSSR